MKKLLKNTNGAVTVFVTFLLIPAILVSGTAVDLTRIYTARSIIQDGNQMAANSVLSQYNALLHDLYGVFGVAKDDPILAELLDEYISLTVFGKSTRDAGSGTLQLFYGSDLSLDELHFTDEMNLRNPDVLRRQIEEYMKFRAPVIIVKEIMDMLGSSTFKADSDTIKQKLEIDDAIARIHEKYKELYDAIVAADSCRVVGKSEVAGAVGRMSSYLKSNIHAEFVALKNCLDAWKDEDDPDKKADLELKYNAILSNISSWTNGGPVGKNWSGGSWGHSSHVVGLNRIIEDEIDNTDKFKPKFDTVVALAAELDAMKDDLAWKIDELEAQINSGQCNPELADALTMRDPRTEKSVIEMYRGILEWDDLEGMAEVFKEAGYGYIDGPVKEMMRDAHYRDRRYPLEVSLSRGQLLNAPSEPRLALSESNTAVRQFADCGDYVSYPMPPDFKKFGDISDDNAAFFRVLKEMVETNNVPPVSLYEGQEEPSGDGSKKKQEKMIDELFSLAAGAYAGLSNNPLGAKRVSIAATDMGHDTINTGNLSDSVEKASSNPIALVLSDPAGSLSRAGDYLLLLTYCTSMFSNYTTARPETNNKKADELDDISFPKSVSGIPISPRVNYFFQSEWEYLYHGSSDAGENLSAVSGLIYLVRVICNYITVFSVSEVANVVSMIRTAFSWSPPLGIVLGELARAAFVAAESAVDLATLRAGYKVSLIKSGKSDEWKCSPSGLVKALGDVMTDAVSEDEGRESEKGLSYGNYLLFFFLAKALFDSDASTELARRTADLIEWNVLNYEHNLNCDEDAMTDMLANSDRFKLEDMKTDFSITTTVNMRMLFLSLLLAQNFAGSRGIGAPPNTMPITMTDHRGY